MATIPFAKHATMSARIVVFNKEIVMTTKSAFSIVGLAHKVCLAAEVQGYTPELFNALAEHPDLFRQTLQLQLGHAEIVVVRHITAVNRAKPFNPAEFIGKGWSIWRGPADGDGLSGEEEQDNRFLSLSEVDWDKILYETCLNYGESKISGEEKLSRIKVAGNISLDAAALLSLWYEEGHKTLKYIQKQKGITYLDAFGTILRDSGGRRYVLYLYWLDGRWYWNALWLGDYWDDLSPSAVLAS